MFGRFTRWVDNTLHPERYHGHGKRPPYFEGWYFKMVSPDRTRRFAVIPGIFLSDDPAHHHAFIQVFDGVSGHVSYHRFPAEQFQAAHDRFDLRIGANRFTLQGITLDISDELRTVRGELRFGDSFAWPVTVASPGVMGWFGWIPFMECYHGVLGFDHPIEGALTVDGAAFDFSGGRGYIEKDWGKSFPGGWVWMQTNHFEQPRASFTSAVAITPFGGSWFPGFLAGLWHDGAFYRFATYNNDRIERLDITDDHVSFVMRGAAGQLEIRATRADASILPGPNRQEMGVRVPETLKASIEVCLSPRGGGAPIFEGRGECAGLEVAGDVNRLLKAINS